MAQTKSTLQITAILEKLFEEHFDKKPESIEPCRGLRSRSEQARRRKCAGKGQRVWNDDQRGKKIAGCEHQDCTLTRDRELSEQQRRREQVVDQQRRSSSRL